MRIVTTHLLLAGMLVLATCALSDAARPNAFGLDALVGEPADIAPSAYQYRADVKAEENCAGELDWPDAIRRPAVRQGGRRECPGS